MPSNAHWRRHTRQLDDNQDKGIYSRGMRPKNAHWHFDKEKKDIDRRQRDDVAKSATFLA